MPRAKTNPFQNPKNPLYSPHVHLHDKTQRAYRRAVPLSLGIDLGRAADAGANGTPGTQIFVELCAMPDKIPFYQKFGFEANEAQRLRIMYKVDGTASC
jgi:hypothetical protein